MSLYIRTPLKPLTRINERCGKNFLVKMECYQPDGSFKIRGVSRLCEDVKARGYKRIVSASGGNSGHAAACCARELGLSCTVVIPDAASSYMADVIRREGATVITHGQIFDDARDYALQIVENDKTAYFLHPFDHPILWEGHSTLVDELKEQTEKPDAIVLSVGGGGLFNGVIEGLDRNGWGDVPVIAAEVEGAPKFHKALEAGHPVELTSITTLANTLAGKTVSEMTVKYVKSHNVLPYLTNDKSAAHAVLEFVEDFRILVELACGASMSVAYELPPVVTPFQNVVIIACGGAGVNLKLLNEYRQIFGL